MTHEQIRDAISAGKTTLGIEFGSTRIKAVLVGEDHVPMASGSYTWESRYVDGIWTYDLEEAWKGLHACYADLASQVERQYGVTLETVGAIGISGMMHGYLPFDAQGRQLTIFRSYRNTITAEAAAKLTELFQFNVPQRWSVAHLCRAMTGGEEHVKRIDYLTTLAGYIHWRLTGQRVLGVGEASGMFPIDSAVCDYDAGMRQKFNALAAEYGVPWKMEDIFPKVLTAGQSAGCLTEEGARLIDASGRLKAGIPLCPPEGDAGTGMTATNAVSQRTGNVSAGTSIFAMLVLEKPLSRLYEEIDMVCTPAGRPVAMVHCNNGTPEMDAWINLFHELTETMGVPVDKGALFAAMYRKALEGAPDCGGLVLYNYLTGEHITHVSSGRPMLLRTPDSKLNLANFMRAQLFSCLATLRIGMGILEREGVVMDTLQGHGGLFKTPEVGQRLMAAATGTAIGVLETAGEGGPWGSALLAAYMLRRKEGQSLEDYLNREVFSAMPSSRMEPDPADVAGFDAFLKRYRAALPVVRQAVEALS